MTEAETLREQLEVAKAKIISLTQENFEMRSTNAAREEEVSNGAKHLLRRDLWETFQKLIVDTASLPDSHARAKAMGFNEAIEKCIAIVRPS